MHNKTLHVTIMHQERISNRIVVDDGSVLNISPLSKLRQLKYDLVKLQQNQANLRAFNWALRDTLGAVTFIIHMEAVEFYVVFHVCHTYFI